MITAIRMIPQKPRKKKAKKEGKVKKSNHNRKKEIVEKYDSDICETDLTNMYMWKPTISTILQRKDLFKEVSIARTYLN